MTIQKPVKKKRTKQLIISVAVAFLLVIADYWIQNRTYPLYDDIGLLTWVDKIIGSNKDFFNEDDVTYINLGKDKMLVPIVDEFGDTIGNDVITNREALLQFLDLASKTNYKYIFLDVRFEKGFETPFDSALFERIKQMPNLVIATHRASTDYAIADSSLLVKAANADYRTHLHVGFSRYEFLQDGKRSVALQLLHDIDHQDIEEHWYGYTCSDGSLCYNMKYIPLPSYLFKSTPTKIQENTIGEQIRYLYLGADILHPRFFSEDEVEENLLNGKIVVVGDFDNDIHDTYIGEIPGPLIPIVAYKYLKAGKHEMSWLYILFLFLLFVAISFVTLTIRNIANIFVKTSLWHYILSLFSIAALFFIIKVLLYCIFSISMILEVPTLVFHFMGSITTYKKFFNRLFLSKRRSH